MVRGIVRGMDKHLLGQTCALLAAIAWAVALVLFKRSGERIPPLALNLFKNVVGLILLVVTLVATRDGIGNVLQFPMEDVYILLISGVIGIALADTLLFCALNRIGVGILSIVDCTYSPCIILLGVLMLSEQLTVSHYVGGVLIVGGVLTVSGITPPAGCTRGQLLAGMLMGLLAIVFMGFGVILVKLVLPHFPLIWATTIRLAVGTVVLGVCSAASPQRKELWSVFRPTGIWWVAVPASVLGTYVSLILWVAGFKYTNVSIASLLNQTSVVFALVFATLILKESFGGRKLAAAVLTIAGIVIVWVAQA